MPISWYYCCRYYSAYILSVFRIDSAGHRWWTRILQSLYSSTLCILLCCSVGSILGLWPSCQKRMWLWGCEFRPIAKIFVGFCWLFARRCRHHSGRCEPTTETFYSTFLKTIRHFWEAGSPARICSSCIGIPSTKFISWICKTCSMAPYAPSRWASPLLAWNPCWSCLMAGCCYYGLFPSKESNCCHAWSTVTSDGWVSMPTCFSEVTGYDSIFSCTCGIDALAWYFCSSKNRSYDHSWQWIGYDWGDRNHGIA